MSAPDPAAALRAFAALDEDDDANVWKMARWSLGHEAKGLLAYVKRLEAALREHAEAITAHRNAVAIDESAMLDCRRSVDTYGNRLATRARVEETQATLLALGREIQGRKP